MSYANMVMYSSVLPGHDDAKPKEDEVISGDDPANVERINKLLFD